ASGCNDQIGNVLTELDQDSPTPTDGPSGPEEQLAAGAARHDPGTGLCGTVVHFKKLGMPLSILSDAVNLIEKMPGDPEILASKIAKFGNINFRSGDPASLGDFTGPSNPDAAFPFSSAGGAMPPGDDEDIAMRLRGYLNVTDTHGGAPVTFAV